MTRTQKIAGATVVAALAAVMVFATGWGHHHGPRDPAQVAAFVSRHVDDALDDVDATPQQRQEIHAVVDRLVQDGQKLRAGHAGVRQELVAQWDAAQPDAAKLHALVDERIDALRAFAHEAVDAGVRVHGILTPQQRAKLSTKIHRHTDGR